MWIVASTKNLNFFKQEVKKKFSDIKFYSPKIKSNNSSGFKFLLGGYLFCYSKQFDNKSFFVNFQFTKGLKKLLFFDNKTNKEIINFINFCRLHEDTKGFIKNTFFKNSINYRGKFINGAFSDQIFHLIDKEKNKIKVIVGDIKISISDKSSFNYSTL